MINIIYNCNSCIHKATCKYAGETYEKGCEAISNAYSTLPVTDVLEVDVKCKYHNPKTSTPRNV